MDNSTILQEIAYKTDDSIGVFIDVWPLDGTPNNWLFRKMYVTYAKIVKKILLASSMKDLKEYGLLKRIEIKIASIFNPKKIVVYFDKIAQRYAPENSDYIASYSDLSNVYKADDYRKRIKMPFEDTELWMPANYHRILKK